MITKILFISLTTLLALYIGNKLKFSTVLAGIFLLVGSLNGMASLLFLVKGNAQLSFNYFLGFDVFVTLGLIKILRRK